LFKGFGKRLRKEIIEFAPISMKKYIHVIELPEKRYNAWIGGFVLSSKSWIENFWISQIKYNESDSSIIHKKTQF
jgi:actin